MIFKKNRTKALTNGGSSPVIHRDGGSPPGVMQEDEKVRGQ